MREEQLRARVLADPGDGGAWHGLARAFVARDAPRRALACLAAAAAAEGPGVAAGPERDHARRALVRRRLALRRQAAGPLGAAPRHRVSVILPTGDDPAAVEQTVASVRAQHGCDFELLLCGASAEARNRTLLRARGRFVAHLVPGSELDRDHLALLCGWLEESGAALAYGRALHVCADAVRLPFARATTRRAAITGAFTRPPAVVHRRDALARTGLFDPELDDRGGHDLWRRFAWSTRVEHVPIVSAECATRPAADPEGERFEALLLGEETRARARREAGRARRSLAAGDACGAARLLARAWDLGLDAQEYLQGLRGLSRRAPRLAVTLVARGGGELEPLLSGAHRRIARGAEARRLLAERARGLRARSRYAEAAARGVRRARRRGFDGDA